MPVFLLKSGHHIDLRSGTRRLIRNSPTKRVQIDSPQNLDFKFGGAKYQRLDGMISTGISDEVSPPRLAEAGAKDEVETIRLFNDPSLAAAGANKAKKAAEADKTKAAAPAARVDISVTEEDILPPPEAPPVPAKGPKGEKDVTTDFPAAGEDYKVFHSKKRGCYVVTAAADTSKPLSKAANALADKKAVARFLKTQTK